ncbi:MAG: D-2-hydroxyacid dehydrogenase [Halolamina sp.]
MSDPDVAVLRQKIHGLPVERYVEQLRQRLPDRTVALARTPAEEAELVARAEVVSGFTLDADLVESAANLRLFACAFAGTGHLPLSAFEAADVAVTNASGVHGPNIAEYVVGGILSFAQGFPRAWRQQDRREWRAFGAGEFAGSTVTVVGMGAIGRATAERLAPFGVDTLAVRHSPEKGPPEGVDEVFGYDEVHEPVSRSEYVVLACPLTETTEGLVDADLLLSLSAEGVLVNVARGPVVDTDALVGALRSNDLRGAVLDVTDPEPLPEDHPLWGFDNALITPHNAGHTPRYYERLADIVADNVDRLARGEEIRNRVI